MIGQQQVLTINYIYINYKCRFTFERFNYTYTIWDTVEKSKYLMYNILHANMQCLIID